ncbi:MAG: tRNA uridine-5-carboxymethylaminomethyl(34) synthesis GTPase MnmE [gamma proteobacterium endosymbiont of Trioza apicalis]
MKQIDTIVAIATPYGRGGIGILRISGSLVSKISYILLGKLLYPRKAEYLPFLGKNNIHLDYGIALFFLSPNSFTGEDVLELQGHGGPIVLDLLLNHILSYKGIRIARPGEFLERAFLNNKLDLIQAEAISDLINANSVQSVNLAINSIRGFFSNRINKLIKFITDLRVYIEGIINFPNEEINTLSNNKINFFLDKIISNINIVKSEAYQGVLLREGIKVVIIGKPNVGKSSLLNTIVNRDVAIVTNISGTTRDILRENIYVDGVPMQIIDTAGICETNDEIERIGIKLAWLEVKQADHILWVTNDILTLKSNSLEKILLKLNKKLKRDIPITILFNKFNITSKDVGFKKIDNLFYFTISAISGEGVKMLLNYLKKNAGFNNNINFKFLARRRHINALDLASIHLLRAKEKFMSNYPIEFLAEELRISHQLICNITGKFTSQDLLDKIFLNFCIGK